MGILISSLDNVFETNECFWSLAKIISSVYFACRSEQASHVIISYFMCNLMMISSPRKSSVLIHNTNRQIRKTPYDQKVNDLCRSFRYFIWWHARQKLVYRVHTRVVAVCTRGHVACEWCLPWWYLSIRLIRATVVVPIHDSIKIPKEIQYCDVWWNLLDNAFDLTLVLY